MATKPTTAPAKKSNNTEANRQARLERTLKAQPNNKQVQAALKTSKGARNKPQTTQWSKTERKNAQLIKQFEGKYDKHLSNATRSEANKYISANKVMDMPKRPFSLGERTKDKFGNYVWSTI